MNKALKLAATIAWLLITCSAFGQQVTMPANNKNIVLISGGASGIGRRMAERFLAQGDSVHVGDVSAELVNEFLAANPGATGTVST